MIFTIDNIPNLKEIKEATWNVISDNLKDLNGQSVSYMILVDPQTNSYIQCAGSTDRLTIELRLFSKGDFKHYRLGNKSNNNVIKWAQINCKVGPINIHENEVMTLKDAQSTFLSFFEKRDFEMPYQKRNMTEEFQ